MEGGNITLWLAGAASAESDINQENCLLLGFIVRHNATFQLLILGKGFQNIGLAEG